MEVINSSFEAKTASIVCYSSDKDGNEKEMIRENLTLNSGEKTLLLYNITIEENETINVRLEK